MAMVSEAGIVKVIQYFTSLEVPSSLEGINADPLQVCGPVIENKIAY